jgi:cell division cycle 14
MKGAIEFIKDRLYWLPTASPSNFISLFSSASFHFIDADSNYVYEPFYKDFGPLNLGYTALFYRDLNQVMKKTENTGIKVVILTSFEGRKRTNAAYLICAYMLISHGLSPDEAYSPLNNISFPFLPYRDASESISTFNITILDCLRALNKATMYGFFDIDKFDLDQYFHYEKVENGDMNWIVPERFLAFSSPVSRRINSEGVIHFTPIDYIPIFKKWNITTILRLNKKMYDAGQFTRQGFRHEELFFPDGGLPSEIILTKFMQLLDECFLSPQAKGAIAVHCRAGLGRTGTLISLYLMRHYRFTATEAIAWIRICRPGSIIGIQQHYLKEMQMRMWKEGENIWRFNYSLLSQNISQDRSETTSPPQSRYFSSRSYSSICKIDHQKFTKKSSKSIKIPSNGILK